MEVSKQGWRACASDERRRFWRPPSKCNRTRQFWDASVTDSAKQHKTRMIDGQKPAEDLHAHRVRLRAVVDCRAALALHSNRPLRGPKPRISLADVVAAGSGDRRRGGPSALSMRKGACRLRVGPMSLYTYVPGRRVVELMIDHVYSEHACLTLNCRGSNVSNSGARNLANL